MHSRWVADVLLEAKSDEHALALPKKRLAIVAQSDCTLAHPVKIKEMPQQCGTLRDVRAPLALVGADVDDARCVDVVAFEALVEVLDLSVAPRRPLTVAAELLVVGVE